MHNSNPLPIRHIHLNVGGRSIPISVVKEGDELVASFDLVAHQEMVLFGSLLGGSDEFLPIVIGMLSQELPEDAEFSLCLTHITQERLSG